MCLSAVIKNFSGRSTTVKIGYKAFDGSYSSPSFPYFAVNWKDDTPLNAPVGKWLKANRLRVQTTDSSNFYTTGFHIFENFEDAENFKSIHCVHRSCVIKVKYKGVLAIGIQQGRKVIVADKIFISKSQVKGKK